MDDERNVLNDSDSEGENEELNVDDPTVNANEHAWLSDFVHEFGPQNLPENQSEYDIFHLFFSDILNLIATESNLYAEQYFQSVGRRENLKQFSNLRQWKDV